MKFKIIRCSDPKMWHRGKIGEVVPLLSKIKRGYVSRETASIYETVFVKPTEIIK